MTARDRPRTPSRTRGRRSAPDSSVEPSDSYSRIYAVVRRIPKGRVATYGQVAILADLPGHARQVGYALHAIPEGRPIPWQRVINARGGCSERSEPGGEQIQRQMLEREGIVFDERGRVELAVYQWHPRLRVLS